GLDSFERIGLDERNVLQSRRVEHCVRLKFGKNSPHAALFAHIHDARHDIEGRVLFPQFDIEQIEMEFRTVRDDELTWTEIRNLPAKFRADRAGRPGDENNLVVDQPRHALEVGHHLWPAEQVSKVDSLGLEDRPAGRSEERREGKEDSYVMSMSDESRSKYGQS